MLNVIIANGLEDFIDGSRPCPVKFLDTEQGIVNPEYTLWHIYNRLIMSWFYASVSENVMTQIVGYNSAQEIWIALAQIFAVASMAPLLELRTQIQSFKKESMSGIDYIQKLKGLCNNLAAIREPVSRNDHLIYMFNGLDYEYNPFVTSINARPNMPSIEEVHSLFLSYEFRLEQQHAVMQVNNAQAHFASVPNNRRNFKPYPNYTNPNSSSPSQNRSPQPNGQPRILGKPQLKSNPKNWNQKPNHNSQNSKPQCQIYGKIGHTTLICYHKANLNYTPQPPRNFNTAFTPTPPYSFNQNQPAASPNSLTDNAWFMDFGATHHFTPDIYMMQNPNLYQGTDRVMVGNGKKLPISHIGNSTLHTPFSTLLLKNILHTPALFNSLLSITKLCSDNRAFVEFHSNFFLVKDQVTKKVLLQGQLDHGLYKVSPVPSKSSSNFYSPSPASFLSKSQAANLWHKRLGHASSKVVSTVLSLCNGSKV